MAGPTNRARDVHALQMDAAGNLIFADWYGLCCIDPESYKLKQGWNFLRSKKKLAHDFITISNTAKWYVGCNFQAVYGKKNPDAKIEIAHIPSSQWKLILDPTKENIYQLGPHAKYSETYDQGYRIIKMPEPENVHAVDKKMINDAPLKEMDLIQQVSIMGTLGEILISPS